MADAAVHTYYLWLDESGDFQEHTAFMPASLVGGVACTQDVRDHAAPSAIISGILSDHVFHEAILADPNCRPDARHSTELPAGIRAPARMAILRACAEAGFRFVIFQNHRKVKVGDSTTNYLNFLAEGIAQYIAHLSAITAGPVHLTVTIGRRVDTVASTPQHTVVIPEDTYIARIRERIELAKARCLFDTGKRVSYDILFGSDKHNNYLVLSDYVCSCQLSLGRKDTRTVQALNAVQPDGRTLRAEALELLRTRGVRFELYEDRTRIELRQYLNSANYGSALFVYMGQKEPDAIARRELLTRFNALDAHAQRVHMEIFFVLVGNFSVLRAAHEELAALLAAFLERLPEFTFRQAELAALCAFNARLYLATTYNHLGRTADATAQLAACEQFLPQILAGTETVDLYYILRNRQAVVLQDDFRFDEALALLEEPLMVAELQENYHQELLRLIHSPSPVHMPEEWAKLLGTYSQTCQYLLPCRPELYEKAVQAAERAVAAFPLPRDRARQQLTWAETEAEAGHPGQAVAHLCAAFGCDAGALAQVLAQRQNEAPQAMYEWYHVMRICRYLAADPAYEALCGQLFALFRQRAKTVFSGSFPAHAAARHAATYCAGYPRLSADREQFYRNCRALCLQKPDVPGAFQMIGFAATAEQALQCAATHPDRVPKWLGQLARDLAYGAPEAFTEGLAACRAQWAERLQAAGEDLEAGLAVCREISLRVPY